MKPISAFTKKWIWLCFLLLPTTVCGLFFDIIWAPFRLFAAPLEDDNVAILDVEGDPNVIPLFWHDSYSVGNRCYCESGFDHGIAEVVVDGTPLGNGTTIREICDRLGSGPGSWGRPIYNDIQCGNGPPNGDAKRDEITCPGRVEHGEQGCGYIGPKWNFDPLGDGEVDSRWWTGVWWIQSRAYLTVTGFVSGLLY